MRLIHYLNEEDSPKDILKKECSQILKIMRKGYFVLYRGFKNVGINDDGSKAQFFSKIPRTGRQPLDTSTAMHTIMDNYFNERFGWRARSEGVFCTTSIKHAKFYGEVYLIFPVNGFKFIYSPRVHDLFDEQNNFIKKYTNFKGLHTFIELSRTNSREVEEAVFKHLDGLKYTDKSLQKAKTNNSEVMIKCAKYYALKLSTNQNSFGFDNEISLADILT